MRNRILFAAFIAACVGIGVIADRYAFEVMNWAQPAASAGFDKSPTQSIVSDPFFSASAKVDPFIRPEANCVKGCTCGGTGSNLPPGWKCQCASDGLCKFTTQPDKKVEDGCISGCRCESGKCTEKCECAKNGACNSACSCIVKPQESTGHTYEYYHDLAVRQNKVLIVWVGQEGECVENCLSCSCDKFPGFPGKGAVIGTPRNGALWRRDVPNASTAVEVVSAMAPVPQRVAVQGGTNISNCSS